ncbi:MAG: hypothetical protein H6811_00335 [Phycisphaeraceae bacterium]|nr:hypothetical protein [Phycisphaeraceae bacterium]
MRVLIADKFEVEGIEALKAHGHEVHVNPDLTPDALPEAIARLVPGVLVVRSTKVPRAAIQASPSLKAIIRAGAGFDNIDINAAGEAGIPVANCPGMNAIAVAELTVGLLICCDRRIPDQVAELRAGRWNKGEFGKSRGLKGRTLGVVGLGAIGEAVIARARALEMPVLAWSRSLTPDRAAKLGAGFGGTSRADLLAMLRRCDAVTIHVAATGETKNMCNAEFFDAMKPGATFINTSRASVVDEAALRVAIKSGGLRAGLDVHDCQPPGKDGSIDSATLELPNVYGTHHCGAGTDQAQLAVAEETVRLIDTLEKTGRLENCVNESMLATARA